MNSEAAKNRKFLFIIHSSAQSGGAEDDILNLMEHFSKKDTCQLFGMFPNAPRQKEYKKFLNKWAYLMWGYFPVINNGIMPYIKYFLKSFVQVTQILFFIRFKRFDACFLSVSVLLWPALLLKCLRQKNIILIKESIEPLSARKFIYKCINFASIYAIPNSEMIVNEYQSITGSGNAECIYSSLRGFSDFSKEGNGEVYASANEGLKFDFSQNDIINVLFVGNIVKVKNPILAVKAIQMLRNRYRKEVRLIIAGSLETEPAYKKEFDRVLSGSNCKNEIFTTGYCNKIDLDYLYRNSDMLLITSISEGIPLVLVYALKIKIPVISTKVGGIPEIIKNGYNGLLVNHNPQEIAETILKLHESVDLKQNIVKNGLVTYKNKFELDSNMLKMDSILNRLKI